MVRAIRTVFGTAAGTFMALAVTYYLEIDTPVRFGEATAAWMLIAAVGCLLVLLATWLPLRVVRRKSPLNIAFTALPTKQTAFGMLISRVRVTNHGDSGLFQARANFVVSRSTVGSPSWRGAWTGHDLDTERIPSGDSREIDLAHVSHVNPGGKQRVYGLLPERKNGQRIFSGARDLTSQSLDGIELSVSAVDRDDAKARRAGFKFEIEEGIWSAVKDDSILPSL